MRPYLTASLISCAFLLPACESRMSMQSLLAKNTGGAEKVVPDNPENPPKPPTLRPEPPSYNGPSRTGSWLFIMAGQSNMSGDGQDPHFPSHDRIKMLVGNRTGSGYAFALSFVYDNPEATIYVVNCAFGGTSIEEWQPYGSLYNYCTHHAKSVTIPVAGVLFFQGEANALRNIDPHGWGRKFQNLVSAFRSDLQTPSLPVVFAQIGFNSQNLPAWDTVKEEQQMVYGPHLSMVLTDDLPVKDGTHFTYDSYLTIGRRMTNAFYKLEAQ